MPPQAQVSTAANPVVKSASEVLAEAVMRHHAGCYAEAEQLYRAVLAVEPQAPDALHGLGLLAIQAGHFPDAVRLLETAIRLDSHQSTYYLNLGNALQLHGEPESAIHAYRQCLMLSPDSGTAHSNLGMALLTLGRYEQAVQHLEIASELQPASSQIQDNLGNALQAVGRPEEAVRHHRRALQLTPCAASQVPEMLGNLGLAFAAMGKWDEATESFERSLHRNPQNARVQLARAQLQLLLGEFESVLRNYEWRKQVQAPRSMPGRPWHGEAIQTGQTLILYDEQGLGDSILALRYLPWVQARVSAGAHLVAEIQQPILRLAKMLPGELQWIAPDEPIAAADWHCSWMSLPLIFMESLGSPERQTARQTTRRTAPAAAPFAVPYPFAPVPTPSPGDSSRQIRLRGKEASGSVWNIGIVWSGNKGHVRDQFRSIPPDLFSPLLDMPNCLFHSLQIEKLPLEFADRVIDHSNVQTDFADTAQLIQQLDLVISVDTSVAHLAGALAAPIWLLLAFWPDWRWGLERQETPWYPTMHLFRQPQPGRWQEVIEAVRSALLLLTLETEHLA
jgi:tetratricopeptide (TPR) repeat protein